MKRVLVTGATGFVGRHALQPLLELGYEVHCAATRPRPHMAGIAWYESDLLQPGAAEALIEQVRPSHLLHLAWYAEPGLFWRSPFNLPWVAASLMLLRAFRAAGGLRMVGAGTCAEYQWDDTVCVERSTPCRPRSLYGVCKNALADITASYAAAEGFSAAWGRVFFLYGPGEHPARFVPSVTRSLLRGEPARCSHGEQIRDFLHVADVASAMCALLDSPVQGPVNIASGVPVTLQKVIAAIAAEIGSGAEVHLGAIPTPADEPHVLVADASRLRDEVGWAPRHSLKAGIAETVSWWRSAP